MGTKVLLYNIAYRFLWLGVTIAGDQSNNDRHPRWAQFIGGCFFFFGFYMVIFSSPNLGEEKPQNEK